MNIYVIILSVIALVFLCGCGSNVQTDRAYQELGRAQHFHLKENGYLIAFEKRKKGSLKDLESADGYVSRFMPIEGNDKLTRRRNEVFENITTGQMKVMLATHITENFPHQKYLYNAYKDRPDGHYSYNASYDALDSFRRSLIDRLTEKKDKPYSHIIVMSMGWNNDQVESVWRYNQILTQLRAIAAENQDQNYHPLVIGFTWPSAWHTISDSSIRKTLGHVMSYGNKANDADELGYTLVNLVLNRHIPDAIDTAALPQRPKVVVIAHSFGARLMSRAVFSQPHLKSEDKPAVGVDLFLGLQGAFSANRFVLNAGREGAPYAEFSNLPTKFVLTTSENDSANPIAHYITGASHVGGKAGLRTANNHPDIFEVRDWARHNESRILLRQDKVLIIDAKSIVVNPDAHNDILDREMAELLWYFIRQLDD
ncbi:alpha/beta hydrolase [Nitrincola nitratireducens]|uniref:Alpha/beta hydrolase family protein n=1 Tax=Nitrincola nitratireducens TaxID=1229521 RepID=W9V258_9GAMM|nr:alpha/beta hydrolase [Nitrincola nitratireducens]EXJ10242.1 hypothetical protein D791_02800 [Nitrincola nitratireducens]